MMTRASRRLLLTLVIGPLAVAGSACDHDPLDAATKPASITTGQPGEPAVSSERIEKSLSAAQTYLDSRDVAKAQAILITLINKAPSDVRARELYGQSFALAAIEADRNRQAPLAADLRDKAYEQYKIAVELEPSSAGLQHSAGQMAVAAGEPDAALAHFQAAGRLDPHNPQYPLFQAQLHIQQKRYLEANECLSRVLAVDPQETYAHASMAIVAMEQGKFDDAVAHIGRARRIAPDDLVLRVQEARIYRRKGDGKRGLELLVGLSESERAQEMVAAELAGCYEQLGEHMKSAEVWQLMYKAAPTSARAWLAAVRAGESLLQAGEREQAWLWLEQARLAAPDAPEVQQLQAAFSR